MYFCGVKVHTDALTTVEKSFRRGGRGGLTLYSERRLLDAMFLTLGNLANFKEIVTNLATVDVHGYVLYTLSKERAIGISAWASALLVQQFRAMREPPGVGRADGSVPALEPELTL